MKPFEEMREILKKQYERAEFAPDSGVTEEELQQLFDAHCAAFPDEPRIMTRAFGLYLLCTKARIVPEPDNMFAGKLAAGSLLPTLRRKWLLEEWPREFGDTIPGGQMMSVVDMPRGVNYMIDLSHTCPDWESILKLGFPGLRNRAAQGKEPLHQAAALVYDGACELCRRLGDASGNSRLTALAERAPQTLSEAFQLAYLFHELTEIEGESVRTMGRFDQLYIDFYRADLAAGRLTRVSAKELIKYFWILFYAKHQGSLFGKNFCFGPEINELSELGMEVYYELNLVDPKLTVRTTPELPQHFLELVLRNIRDGRNGIAFLNDPLVISGLIRHGRSPEDAAAYVPIGCYEPAVAGKELSLSGATTLYLPMFVIRALNRKEPFATFAAFEDAFYEELRDGIAFMERQQRRCETIWPRINPAPFLSGSFPSCIASGRDLSEGGAKYNTTGCVVAHLADAVDSLAAVEYLVYERRMCTLDELRQALAADWHGFEQLQQAARVRPPKWGNNDPRADHFAVELANVTAPLLNQEPNGRGGHFFASIYGQLVVERGALIGALPNGRNAGTPVSKNLDACISMDRNGITALMNSAVKLDLEQYPCGTCLDVMLHPSAVAGDDGIAVLTALVRAFLSRGGSGLQFNILDATVLRDAQAHPERYANLQVRVCGWNSRFTDLTPEAQNTFIAQAEAMV